MHARYPLTSKITKCVSVSHTKLNKMHNLTQCKNPSITVSHRGFYGSQSKHVKPGEREEIKNTLTSIIHLYNGMKGSSTVILFATNAVQKS